MTVSAGIADTRYRQVQTLTQGVVSAVQALWRDVSPDRILSAMSGTTGTAILNAVVAGQLSAAQGAQAFVTSAMLAQGAGVGSTATLNPGALAGLAADGRPLATMLYLPALSTQSALAAGLPPEAAALRGLNQMAMMVGATVTDTARTATQVAMTAEPKCHAYVRVVKLPACSRCIILAGRQYGYSEGFKRHPRCDCGMEPLSDAEWRSQPTPAALVQQMSPEERQRVFGAAGADALDKGADLSQVVNARRGMSTTSTGKRVTREGTTRRGIGGKSLADAGFAKASGKAVARTREARLMPEQILKQAHGDRDLQIALLKKHGYIS